MSEIITGEIIGAIALIVCALIPVVLPFLFRRRKGITEEIPTAPIESDVGSKAECMTQESMANPALPVRTASRLSHSEIVNAIESQPPSLEETVHDKFVGYKIEWKSELYSISRRIDSVTILGNIPDGCNGCLFCNTSMDEAQKFEMAPKGTSFKVRGMIERISRFEVDLTECSFELF